MLLAGPPQVKMPWPMAALNLSETDTWFRWGTPRWWGEWGSGQRCDGSRPWEPKVSRFSFLARCLHLGGCGEGREGERWQELIALRCTVILYQKKWGSGAYSAKEQELQRPWVQILPSMCEGRQRSAEKQEESWLYKALKIMLRIGFLWSKTRTLQGVLGRQEAFIH